MDDENKKIQIMTRGVQSMLEERMGIGEKLDGKEKQVLNYLKSINSQFD
jgi:hypothetical protein